MNHYPRMTALARTFPTLCNGDLKGIEPFEAVKLQRDLGNPAHSTASRYAALFVLSVFNSTEDWKTPTYSWRGEKRIKDGDLRFSAVRAMGVWDDRHQAAFVAWCRAPWWE